MGRALLALSLLVWALLAASGVSGYLSIRQQGVAGFPNNAQTILYLVIPIAVAAGCALLLAFYARISPRLLISLWTAIALLSILPYLVISRGGV